MTTRTADRKSDGKGRSFHLWRIRSIVLAVVLLISYFSFSTPPQARAASLSPIGWTNSYYLDSAMANMNKGDLQKTFSAWGTAEAENDNAIAASRGGCTNGQYTMYVMIDYGQPFSTYISTFGTAPDQSWSQAQNIALAYAKSWYSASYSCFRLHLAMGVNNQVCLNWASTNNTDPCVSTAGNALAQAVESANATLASLGSSWQVDISGGIDAESDAGFGSYSTTLGFVNAYNAKINTYTTKYQLYDFGDATHSCNLDWSCDPSSRVYNIAWSIGYDYPFPEAYSTGQNSNWLGVSQYSSRTSNPIQYSIVMLDASQAYCSDTACWQDFANKNGTWIQGGVLAGSAQLPLG